MNKIMIINAHDTLFFSKGALNNSLVSRMKNSLEERGHEVKTFSLQNEEVIVEEQLGLITWADRIIIQFPLYWMGVPWRFKKYMDEVFTPGLRGILTNGDGRSAQEPKKNYGTAGLRTQTKYMFSVTMNAPEETFNNPKEYLLEGKSLEDLLFPLHVTFRYLGMSPLPTFACYDVIKNPEIDKNFKRLEIYFDQNFHS